MQRAGFPRLGDLIGPYRLVEGLGMGGYTVIFRAVDTRAESQAEEVALKMPLLGPFAEESVRASLRHEARVLARLDGAASPRCLDLLTDPAALVLERIVGLDLAARLARDGALPAAEAEALAGALVHSLGAIHDLGVVHGDVKPGNVMGDADVGIRLIDFGQAVLLSDPQSPAEEPRASTREFMSPERLRGQPASVASDWWSVGVTLYQAATNRLPFPQPPEAAEREATSTSRPQPPSRWNALLSDDFDRLVLGLLDPDPVRRAEWAAGLRAVG